MRTIQRVYMRNLYPNAYMGDPCEYEYWYRGKEHMEVYGQGDGIYYQALKVADNWKSFNGSIRFILDKFYNGNLD